MNRKNLRNAFSGLAVAAALFAGNFNMMHAAPQSTEPGAPQLVPFDTTHWELNADSEFVTFDGRRALKGSGYIKDVSLRNGTIETDIWAPEVIGFAGILFHIKSFEDNQLVWFRIHKTNGLAGDGVQYAPAYHGVFCWQLNPKANAAAKLPKNEWVHLKLVILNGTAAFYVKDMSKPVMTIDRLRPGPGAGSIGVWTYSKSEIYFSNFSYQPTADGNVAEQKPVIPPNVLADWRLSPSYPLAAVDAVPTVYPAQQLTDTTAWIVPEVDASGLIDISRYHGTKYHGRNIAAAGRPNWTILRTFIDSATAKRVKMNFGYSDSATIFLNGVPLFSGNNAFLARNGLDSGWIGFSDAVFLDLKKGRNELLAVTAEDFGGWGFQAKLDDMDGIRVSGR